MKFFQATASSENERYTYDNFIYRASFGINSRQIKETNYNQLKSAATDALNRKNSPEALNYARKMAIEYGVAGLIFLIDTYLTSLSVPGNDELRDAELSQFLAYLYFAKHMVAKNESKALNCINKFKMEIGSNFWTKREIRLCAHLDDPQPALDAAKEMADSLISECNINKSAPLPGN